MIVMCDYLIFSFCVRYIIQFVVCDTVVVGDWYAASQVDIQSIVYEYKSKWYTRRGCWWYT